MQSQNWVETQGTCIMARDTLLTDMTAGWPVKVRKYRATYEYECDGHLFCKDVVFKKTKDENGKETRLHPYKVTIAYKKTNPRKAKVLWDK